MKFSPHKKFMKSGKKWLRVELINSNTKGSRKEIEV
jgi:hypothetical protein